MEEIINNSNKINIRFTSEYGSSCACWVGASPIIGEVYDVELEIDDALVWGENLSQAEADKHAIALEEDMFILTGTVISLEEDGCLSIALGESVVLLEVYNAPEYISGLVECRASNVRMYSTNL